MEETDLDEMNPEFGNEFWKELTDDVLDTLYSQLEYVQKGTTINRLFNNTPRYNRVNLELL
jgi:hypothetical protein